MQTLTPRHIRKELAAADRRLGELEPWLETLIAARQRWMLIDTPEARWTRPAIDEGVVGGAGCPNDPVLEPLGRGWPGLRKTREEIAYLREKRSALEIQLPSPEAFTAAQRDADGRAAEITERIQGLDRQTTALREAVISIANLALDAALEARGVWQANLALDKLCSDADIPRPATERRSAPIVAGASAVGLLLNGYFTGDQPEAVDSSLVRAIRTVASTTQK